MSSPPVRQTDAPHLLRGGRGGLVAAVQPRLGGLDVPVGKVAPEEVVQRAPRLAKVVAVEVPRDIVHRAVQAAHDPALRQGQRRQRVLLRVCAATATTRRARGGRQLGPVRGVGRRERVEDELARVPKLVGEVAVGDDLVHRQV